eukprot:359561-Chlamydomonas_euryale.AAC.1
MARHLGCPTCTPTLSRRHVLDSYGHPMLRGPCLLCLPHLPCPMPLSPLARCLWLVPCPHAPLSVGTMSVTRPLPLCPSLRWHDVFDSSPAPMPLSPLARCLWLVPCPMPLSPLAQCLWLVPCPTTPRCLSCLPRLHSHSLGMTSFVPATL